VGRLGKTLTPGKEIPEFEGGFLYGIQFVMEGCIRVMGLSVSAMEPEIPGSHDWTASEESMGRFVMTHSQGKESLCFDYRREGDFPHVIQLVLEDCIRVMGWFVSVTEDDIQGSLERNDFEMEEGSLGSHEQLVIGMVGVQSQEVRRPQRVDDIRRLEVRKDRFVEENFEELQLVEVVEPVHIPAFARVMFAFAAEG
jgi:hypothetical protein